MARSAGICKFGTHTATLHSMVARRLTRLLVPMLSVIMVATGLLRVTVTTDSSISFAAAPSAHPVFFSAPRQSLPVPVHDEATCAFCQAAAFAPHSAPAGDELPLVSADEQVEHLVGEYRIPHFHSSSPPRSRAPPSLQLV
jgi:hypothetical protein